MPYLTRLVKIALKETLISLGTTLGQELAKKYVESKEPFKRKGKKIKRSKRKT